MKYFKKLTQLYKGAKAWFKYLREENQRIKKSTYYHSTGIYGFKTRDIVRKSGVAKKGTRKLLKNEKKALEAKKQREKKKYDHSKIRYARTPQTGDKLLDSQLEKTKEQIKKSLEKFFSNNPQARVRGKIMWDGEDIMDFKTGEMILEHGQVYTPERLIGMTNHYLRRFLRKDQISANPPTAREKEKTRELLSAAKYMLSEDKLNQTLENYQTPRTEDKTKAQKLYEELVDDMIKKGEVSDSNRVYEDSVTIFVNARIKVANLDVFREMQRWEFNDMSHGMIEPKISHVEIHPDGSVEFVSTTSFEFFFLMIQSGPAKYNKVWQVRKRTHGYGHNLMTWALLEYKKYGQIMDDKDLVITNKAQDSINDYMNTEDNHPFDYEELEVYTE